MTKILNIYIKNDLIFSTRRKNDNHFGYYIKLPTLSNSMEKVFYISKVYVFSNEKFTNVNTYGILPIPYPIFDTKDLDNVVGFIAGEDIIKTFKNLTTDNKSLNDTYIYQLENESKVPLENALSDDELEDFLNNI